MYNPELIDTVDKLKAAKKIRRDAEIVAKTGYSKGLVSRYLNGKEQASETFLEKFQEVYREEIQSLGGHVNSEKFLQIVERLPKNGRGTPYLGELDIFAGKVDVANADLSEFITGYISIPGFRDADYFVNVRGHSAYPKYAQGDMIAIKHIDMEFIQYGQFYVVVTKQDRVLKKVRKTIDPKILCLKSENPEFDDIEIKRTDIKQMFLVLGKITKDVL